MERVYVFLIRNDVWIYIICTLGLLWYLNELISSQRALRRAMFGLERETALRTRNKALLLVSIFIAIAAVVIDVNTRIRPMLPSELLRPPTPTIQSQFSPTIIPTATTPEAPPTPTSPIAPTVTLPGPTDGAITGSITTTAPITGAITLPPETPNDTPAPPGAPAVTATIGPTVGGCTPAAIITEPREGATILGLLNLYGSANTIDFAHYEVEIRGPQTNDRWASLVGRRIAQPVADGTLAGNVNLSSWQGGEYDIRLRITNVEGDVTNECGVSILLRSGSN